MKFLSGLIAAFGLALSFSTFADFVSNPYPDLTSGTVNPNGAGAGNTETLALLAAQSGVLLDTFKRAGDADDTAALNRAITAGVPILLGPKTYTINDFSSGAVSTFILVGIPGSSVVQRTSASSSYFFNVAATTVYIYGVIFDANKASVSANQFAVYMGAGGQNIDIENSTFKNNSGSSGNCLSILSTGPGAGGKFYLSNLNVSGCTLPAIYLASVSNGVVANSYVHDNQARGILVDSNGAASGTNYSTNILITGNRLARNVINVQAGAYSPPYAFGTPSATYVSIQNNLIVDQFSGATNSYLVTMQGDYLSAIGNRLWQTSASGSVFGGFDCNSRFSTIANNNINLLGSSYGIDTGGSISQDIRGNTVTVTAGKAITVGDNQNSVVETNTLNVSGSAIAVAVGATEQDGNGVSLPGVASNIIVRSNSINMSGTGTLGIKTFDNAGGYSGALPIQIRNNSFAASGGALSAQDITYFASSASLEVSGNQHNGTTFVSADPNGSGDIIIDNVFDGVIGISSTSNIRSIITPYINSFGTAYSGSNAILYSYPTAGGSGYTAATTLAAAGGGCSGWSGTPIINQGVILGVAQSGASGSGCATATITATDSGGGTGATFAFSTVPALPQNKSLTYFGNGNLISKNSGSITFGAQGQAIQLSTNYGIQLTADLAGLHWQSSAYQPLVQATQVNVSGAITAPFGILGVGLFTTSSTQTDSTTAAGTVTSAYFNHIATPTFATTGNAITITNAYTWDIQGCPIAGAGVTITTCGALRIGSGQSTFGGIINAVAGMTLTGGTNINVSNNNGTNIGTGTTANAVGIGGGSNGVVINSNQTGSLKEPGLISTGTKFTTSGCSVSSTTGGATAGVFTLGANSCTVVVTMNGATGLTAPTGWTCQAHDRTGISVIIDGESSSTATTASIVIPVTAGATDVISFSCTGF